MIIRTAVLASLFVGTALASTAQAQSQTSAAPKPIVTQDLEVDGVVAEVLESTRQNGVLSVRVRFRNNGAKQAKLLFVDAQGYVHTYIVAGDTKYPLLRDTSGKEVATPRDGGGWLEPSVRPAATWSWWGRFRAPPAEQKQYTLYLKVGPPIDNIPISDKP